MRKNGFTLVEILCAVVILGILAVIIIPKINSSINNSKQSSIVFSSNGLINSFENYVLDLKQSFVPFNGCKYDFSKGINTCQNFIFSGRVPDCGVVNVSSDGKINGYVVFSNEKVTISDNDILNIEKGECRFTNTIKFVNQKVLGSINVGDLLELGGETFYVVSTDSVKTTLLSRYNLNVGNNIQSSEYGEAGMQNSLCLGWNSNSSTKVNNHFPCTLGFASSNYWNGLVGDNLTYKGSYSEPYFPYVFDSNSDLYSYVDAYKSELIKLNYDILEARLLTYQEAKSLGCNYSTLTCPTGSSLNSFITEVSFYMGFAFDSSYLMSIDSDGEMSNYSYTFGYYSGVRPVIVVNTEDILV